MAAARTMRDISVQGFDPQRGFALLRHAIDKQKRGRVVPDLWAELFSECGADNAVINRLVRDYSDAVAQGYPKLDVYTYRACVRAKVKEHEYLLHALYDGHCFTNRKITPETYMALFENAERLAAIQAVSTFLGNKFIDDVMIQAGELIHTEWEEEMSVEETSSLDRFFASVHESPQKLAQSIARRCHDVGRSQGSSSIQQQFDWMQSLAELSCEMFAAVRAKRHDLEIRYHRERVLAETSIANWLACVPFHEMWDSLLYGSTQLLVHATEKDFEDPLAKPLTMHCIRIAQQLSDSLASMLLDNTLDGYMSTAEMDQEDLLELPDRYATMIVNACFGRHKTSKADMDVYRQLMILCKSGKCFNALFMLLYVCLEDSRQLYDIMREWNPTSGAVNGTFAHFVFEKWMRGGTTRDMQHLLKGPAELDARLVQYLVFEERYDLAAAVQIRMGNLRGARQTIYRKQQFLDHKRDVSNLYLLSCCVEDTQEASRGYLQLKLNCICHRFNFIAIPAETMVVLQELIYLMHRSTNYDMLNAALDIFVFEQSGFYRSRSSEWMELWRILAGFMELDEMRYGEENPLCYNSEDFYLLQRACDMLSLSWHDREEIHETMTSVLSERSARQGGPGQVPEHVNRKLLTALSLG